MNDEDKKARLEAEVQEYEEKLAKVQLPSGKEPALQFLILPQPVTLPAYSKRADYLSPQHCRLCLKGEGSLQEDSVEDAAVTPGFVSDDKADHVSEEVSSTLSADMLKHIRCSHGLETEQAYRTEVFSRAKADCTQPVTMQVLRSRLHAYKGFLCEENFKPGVCACCARTKKHKNLREVVFPTPDAGVAPQWLGFSADDWLTNRVEWHKQAHEILSINMYLENYFCSSARLAEAKKDLVDARVEAEDKQDLVDARSEAKEQGATESGSESGSAKVAQAERWLDRVQNWQAHMLEDLRGDSVPAPGLPGKRWMLYGQACHLDDGPHGLVRCKLCPKCRLGFTEKSKDGVPRLVMPPCARARGLWGGPEPEQISELTYVERKILRLARVYVCVKKLMREDAKWARGSTDALPQYTTKNAVAFAQDPEQLKRLVGVMPEDLVSDVAVQFQGSDPRLVQKERSFMVSIPRLRAAIWWFSTHSWPWMQATRAHDVVGEAALGKHLERLLEAYSAEVRGAVEGVPRSLCDAATQLVEAETALQEPGPADALQGSDGEGEDASRAEHSKRLAADQSLAVLESGSEKQHPLQLWNLLLKKFKVFITCVSRAGYIFFFNSSKVSCGTRTFVMKSPVCNMHRCVHQLYRYLRLARTLEYRYSALWHTSVTSTSALLAPQCCR